MFRYIVGYYVSGICYGLGFFWVLRDKEKKGWHDQISDSVVYVSNRSIELIGTIIAVGLIAFNIFLTVKLVQSIKVNTNLHKDIYENIELWKTPLLENDKPAGTIDSNSEQLVI